MRHGERVGCGMNSHRTVWHRWVIYAAATITVAGPAWGAEGQPDRAGWFLIPLGLLTLVPSFNVLLTVLVPRLCRRVQRALGESLWTCAGWGALTMTLVAVLAGVLGRGGRVGQGAASLVIATAVLGALLGTLGIARMLGDRALRECGHPVPAPLSVLVGSIIGTWACAIPVVGWAAGFLALVASLGATVQVLLQPGAFDGPQSATTPPDPDPDLSALGKVSVIIPVYNEQSTVHEVIERVRALPLPLEIVVVDDGSTDGTAELLVSEQEEGVVTVYTSPANFGKGAAIRIGLTFVRGEVVIIQDADLELDPEEYPRLLEPIRAGKARVVYGSRFLHPGPGIPRRTRLANALLALWCNLLYGSRLSDVSTAYKVFRTDVVRGLQLRSVGFEFCAEVTAKLLRAGEHIVEVPVGYHPRSESEGKKLNYLRDGLKAAWWLLWLRFAPLPATRAQG